MDMGYAGYKKRKRIYIGIIVICLIWIALEQIPGLYARFATGSNEKDGARVAVFGHDETIDVPSEWTSELVPGSTASYHVTLTNKNEDGKVSETDQTYELEVITAGNLPFEYTLKKGDAVIGEFSETENNKSHVFAADDMKFSAVQEETHTYTLNVQWLEEKNSADLAGIPDFIQININVKQSN